MRPALRAVSLLLLLLCLAAAAPAQVPPPEPYVLFSPNGRCTSDGTGCWEYYATYYVFIELQDITDATGVSFRLDSSTFGPEDFGDVVPHDDITIVSGDLFSGIELSWPAGSYVSDTLLTIPISLADPPGEIWGYNQTVDVEVYRVGGETLDLVDGSFYCTHCYGTSAGLRWIRPDTIEVPVGVDTTLAIKCDPWGSGGTGTNIAVSDNAGWIAGCSGCGIYVPCGGCPWVYQYVLVDLSIPADAGGTHSTVTLTPTGPCCIGDGTSFVVSAIAPVATESTSWGSMKARFKRE